MVMKSKKIKGKASKMRKIYSSALCLIILSSCSDKIPLEGKRESVFSKEKDKDKSHVSVKLADQIEIPNMENLGFTKTRLMPHGTLGEKIEYSKEIYLNFYTGRDILSPPLVIKDEIFVLGSGDVLKVYDFNSGTKIWELSLLDPTRTDSDAFFGGGMAYDQGNLYISTSLGELVAVSLTTKTILWKKQLSGISRGAPVIEKDIVSVVTENNRTAAYSTKNGQAVWTHEGTPESASVALSVGPASNGSTLVIPYSSGELVALKSANGAFLWSKILGESKSALAKIFPHITANPVIKDEFVYAGSLNDQFAKISLKNGQVIWDAKIGAMGLPIISGNTIFLTTSKRTVVALSEVTGKIIWETELPATNPDLFDKFVHWSPPALGGEKLYVSGTTGQLFVLNTKTGEILEKIDLPGIVTIQPIVVKNTLLMITQDGQLLMYR